MTDPTKVLREMLDELTALYVIEARQDENPRTGSPPNAPPVRSEDCRAANSARVEAGRLLDELASWLDDGGYSPRIVSRAVGRAVGLCTFTVDDPPTKRRGPRGSGPRLVAASIPHDLDG